MKIYTDKYGNVFDGACPNPFHIDGLSISPMSDEKFIELGGIIEDDGEPTHMEELDNACDNFIEIVLEISDKIGDSSYYGGIDEQNKLFNSQYTKEHPTEASILWQRWNGANLQCDFLADKPDLIKQFHSPNWYHYAWARYAQKLEAGKK